MSDTNTKTGARADESSQSTIAHLAGKAHDTVDSVAERARQVEHDVRARAADATELARESEQRAAESLRDGTRRTRLYLRRNPLVGIGAGFAAGAVAAALLLRR